jgi:hypothetical protein
VTCRIHAFNDTNINKLEGIQGLLVGAYHCTYPGASTSSPCLLHMRRQKSTLSIVSLCGPTFSAFVNLVRNIFLKQPLVLKQAAAQDSMLRAGTLLANAPPTGGTKDAGEQDRYHVPKEDEEGKGEESNEEEDAMDEQPDYIQVALTACLGELPGRPAAPISPEEHLREKASSISGQIPIYQQKVRSLARLSDYLEAHIQRLRRALAQHMDIDSVDDAQFQRVRFPHETNTCLVADDNRVAAGYIPMVQRLVPLHETPSLWVSGIARAPSFASHYCCLHLSWPQAKIHQFFDQGLSTCISLNTDPEV